MVTDDQLREYIAMRAKGAGPRNICARARENDLGTVQTVYIVRKIFGLSLEDAKEMSIEVSTGEPIEKYYEDLLEVLEEAAKTIEAEDNKD